MDSSAHRLLDYSLRRIWMGILLAVLVVGVGACDRLSTESGLGDGAPSNRPAALEGSAPLDSLRLLPMSKDQDLLPPEQASKGGLDRLGTSDSEGLPTNEMLPPLQSPYGCVMSTPNLKGKAPYQYEAVYAFFPDDMIAKAGRRTQHVRFQMASRTAYTEGERSVAHILRKARCRVPDTEKAPKLMRKRLERFPAASEKTITSSDGEPVWSGVPVSEGGLKTQSSTDDDEGEWKCVEFTKVCDNCTVSRGPDGAIIVSCDCRWVCTNKVYVKGDDGGGDGSREDQTGDDPDGCNYEGDSSEELCGGGMPPPDSGDEVNETEVCSSDPLADMDIRPTCAGIEGGRFGEEARQDAQGNTIPHWGLDLGGSDAEIGTEISAVEGGTAYRVDRRDDGWGNFVIVKSDNTWYLYAHLSKIAVEGGDSIDEGKKIGEMGESGNAEDARCNSVHLHLEVRKGESWPSDDESKRKDPEEYIGTEFSSDGEPVSDEC